MTANKSAFRHVPGLPSVRLLAIFAALLAAACGAVPPAPTQTLAVSQTPRVLTATPAVPALIAAGSTAIPTPLSTLTGAFTWQIDEVCGYRFLRPAAWVGPDPDCMLRQYRWADPQSSVNRLALIATNYRALAQQPGMANLAQYEAFQADSTLAGWTRLIEAQWASNHITITLSTNLPQARVYALEPGACACVLLAGFKLDQGQPLALSLWAYGVYASQDGLRAEHLWDDFLTMLASLQAAAPTVASPTPTLRVVATDTARPTLATAAPAVAPTALPTPASGYPLEIHQTFSTGLTVDEYALAGEPTLDPLNFTPLHLTWADIMAKHRKDGGPFAFYNFGFDNQGSNISADWHGQTLIAHETYTNATPGIVTVDLAGQLILTLPIGHGGPLNALQQLLTVDDHWFLEVLQATYGTDPITSVGTVTTTGQIVEDGLLLNARDGYEQLFGLQLLRGKPFYFYQRNGQIGAAYDRHTLPLGYDSVAHYGCCSYAELNPQPRANMVSFFAQKAAVWYYVEIGAFR